MSLWRRIYEDRRSLILPLGVALVANIAVLALGVLPMQRALAAAESAEEAATVELTNARRLREQAGQVATSRQEANEQLREFYGRILPSDFAVARKTTNLWLQQAALDAGLSFKASRFDTEPIDDSQLSRASATVVLEGRYADIRQFLYAVETAEEFIVVERVDLEQSDNRQLEGGDRLGVRAVVSTYFPTAASK